MPSQRHRLEPFAASPKSIFCPHFRAPLMATATSKTDTAHGSNPAPHTEMQVQTFSARRGFRPTNQGDRTPVYYLHFHSPTTNGRSATDQQS